MGPERIIQTKSVISSDNGSKNKCLIARFLILRDSWLPRMPRNFQGIFSYLFTHTNT